MIPRIYFASLINDILHNKKTSKLPDHKSSQQLAEDFSLFFMCKIQKIRDSFPVIPSAEKNQAYATCHWDAFTLATESDISQIISKTPSPTCLLDPMPTSMIKQLLDPLLPTITSIVNASLSYGVVPDSFKSAVVTPLLKKPGLDPNVLKNYRPVSNLSYLSKVLERVVAKQLTDHMSQNNLHESRQAAYKRFHSTETTLLKVHNDIMWTMERKGITILVLLDLSAAFDVIDHNVLFTRMELLLGIRGMPLQWFKSYLAARTQRVHIDGSFSSPQDLSFGVPQGSCLGPQLFLVYMLPLGNIIRKHDMELQMYADDTQIYVSICPVTPCGVVQAVSKIEVCITEVHKWMMANFLKLNAEKTEVLLIGFHAQLAKIDLSSMNIAGVNVTIKSDPIRNLGVMFDTGMTMSAQVASVLKSANYHLVNIGRARRLLTEDTTKTAIHSLVTSRFDYCNSLLVGISQKLQKKLQNVQRTSARLIFKKRKFDSITAELINELHWLPIKQRIDYKILALVYKALHGQAPSDVTDMLQITTRRQLRSSCSDGTTLVEPRTRCVTFGDRAFSAYAPRLWNRLPGHIKDSTFEQFKKLLMSHLFKNAYQQ